MLVLFRKVGESILIEDVRFTVVRVSGEYAEVALAKVSGGAKRVLTLTKNQWIEICYNVKVTLISIAGSEGNGDKTRFAFEYPEGVSIVRGEVSDHPP